MALRRATATDGMPSIQIYRLKPGQKAILIFLAQPEEFYTHFIDRRSMPCLAEQCPWCPGALDYKAYAKAARVTYPGAVQRSKFDTEEEARKKLEPVWEPVIIEFTDSPTWQALDFRGCTYYTERGQSAFGRPQYILQPTKQDMAELPQFELIPSLCRIWGLPCAEVMRDGRLVSEPQAPNAPTLRLPPRVQGGER